jgi:hypothetical protein
MEQRERARKSEIMEIETKDCTCVEGQPSPTEQEYGSDI